MGKKILKSIIFFLLVIATGFILSMGFLELEKMVAANRLKQQSEKMKEVMEERLEIERVVQLARDEAYRKKMKEGNVGGSNENNIFSMRDFSFAVFGDIQSADLSKKDGDFQKALGYVMKINPDLVFFVGDIFSSCNKRDCQHKLNNWKKSLDGLFPQTYAAMGNHDRTDKETSDKIWQDFFAFPQNGPQGFEELVYSFDYMNSHFVILNSEKPNEHEVEEAQLSWLENDLVKNIRKNIFVFVHEPAFPVSSKIGESLDTKKSKRDEFWKVLEKHKVTAIFSGHEHLYSRKKIGEINQLIVGDTDALSHDEPASGMADFFYQGSHFAIVRVSAEGKVVFEVYDVEGNKIETYEF